jgi:hypothetical protein
MSNTPTRSAADILRDLHAYLAPSEQDVDSMSASDVAAYLKKSNIDPAKSFAAMQEWMDEKLGEIELVKARAQRLSALETATTRKSFGDGLCEKIHNLISTLRPQVAAAYFSKFEQASEEDMQSLYEDLLALDGTNRKDPEDE